LKRIEPNLLLAIATAIPMTLLVMTASLFGEPGHEVKYITLAIVCTIAFIGLNSLMAKRTGKARPPMIHPLAASTAIWSSLFPMILIIMAAIPVFFAGHDYGLMIIIGAVIFGGTVESAIKARKAG